MQISEIMMNSRHSSTSWNLGSEYFAAKSKDAADMFNEWTKHNAYY